MVKIFSGMILIGLCLMSTALLAKPVEIDQTQSTILFQINHEAGYTVGTFDQFTAVLDLSDDGTAVQSVKADINTTSINTHNAIRDEGLKSEMFLDSAQFPQAHFESTSSEGNKVTGQLTLKGATHPIDLTVHIDDKVTPHIVHLTGSFNRHDYGVTYNSMYPRTKQKVIGDTVDVTVTLATK